MFKLNRHLFQFSAPYGVNVNIHIYKCYEICSSKIKSVYNKKYLFFFFKVNIIELGTHEICKAKLMNF